MFKIFFKYYLSFKVGSQASKCVLCDSSEKLAEQLFCTSCGSHYHTGCLSPPVDSSAMVRIEWQCAECKMCQKCRETGDESKMLVCDSCDKCCHTYCTKYGASTTIDGGWRCETCSRVCLNCNVIISRENDSFCFDCVEMKRNFAPEKRRSVKDLLLASNNLSNSASSPGICCLLSGLAFSEI